jgi:hypothetical protein
MVVGIKLDREAPFISRHILELNGEIFGQLSVGVLGYICGSQSLRIPNENWLPKLILDSRRRFGVRFEYLSPNSIDSCSDFVLKTFFVTYLFMSSQFLNIHFLKIETNQDHCLLPKPADVHTRT